MEENGGPNDSGSRQNGPSGPEIRLESTRGEPGRRSTARRGSGGTMDHPIKPLGGGSIKNRQGEGQSASQNGLARKSAGLDGLVSARATGNREPEGMNEILRNIPPRRAVLPVPEPTRASPRADGTFPETGD